MSTQLPNGLWADFQPFEDARVKANANFNQLDWSQWKCIIAQLADAGDLPGSPSVGDSYLVSDTEVHVFYNSQWNVFTPPCGFIFYDQTLNEFFFNNGGITQSLATFFSLSDMTPVGVIHIFDDYGILTLPAKYVWCDGSTISNPSSPLDGLVASDMSGLTIVGYGTIGGGDIDTVAYDATLVGNIANQINIAHTHAHAHTHTVGASAMAGQLNISNDLTSSFNTGTMSNDDSSIAGDTFYVRDGDGTTVNDHHLAVDDTVNNHEGQHIHDMPDLTHDHGITGSGSVTSGAASVTNTDSSLSATQSIQPRSKKVRFILKILP